MRGILNYDVPQSLLFSFPKVAPEGQQLSRVMGSAAWEIGWGVCVCMRVHAHTVGGKIGLM